MRVTDEETPKVHGRRAGGKTVCALMWTVMLVSGAAWAQVPIEVPDTLHTTQAPAEQQATTNGLAGGRLTGVVTDPAGAVVEGARIELLNADGQPVFNARSDARGRYALAATAAGRYSVRAAKEGFRPAFSEPVFVSTLAEAHADTTLQVGTFEQAVTVTAQGVPVVESQIGASISVVPQAALALDIQDTLRLTDGVQMSSTGQRGAVSSLFVRGGNSNANKVLIDGIPVNDIGGTVNFGAAGGSGLGNLEVYRGPDSALYGSDAEAGVVSLQTRRGATAQPLFEYAGDGGNFGSYQNRGSVSGAYKLLDYSVDFSRYDTSNSERNSQFHNGTLAGNFGVALTPHTEIRGTVRRVAAVTGEPNALDFYGIADDQTFREHDTLFGAALEDQSTEKWHNLVRYGGLRLRQQNSDPAASGIATVASEGAFNYCFTDTVYLGTRVTIKGANGYRASGQALYACDGNTPSRSVVAANRNFVYAQTDYRFNEKVIGLVGFRYEDERGHTEYVSPFGGSPSKTTRGNYSTIVQLSGSLFGRLNYTVGSDLEHNDVFGFAATPRASVAYYMIRPKSSGILTGTKVRFNFGKGILEPSIAYQTSSLYDTLAALPNGQQLIAQYHITPIGPQQSRTYDGGVEQAFFASRGVLKATYFHNEFGRQVEYVGQGQLIEVGVPPALANQIAGSVFGAYLNSLDFSAQGAELSVEYRLPHHFFGRAGYTYLDAKVQHSFSSDNAFPSENPNLPGVLIGAYSPLVGQRPFRRASHSGYFSLSYERARWTGEFRGSLVSRRDDSTFLADSNGGNTLLLPNRNLDPGYERLGLSGSYQAARHFNVYVGMDNLLSQRIQEVIGYPTLPFTAKAGVKMTFGGAR